MRARGSTRCGFWRVASGVAAGVAILVRPAMLFFLPLAALLVGRAAPRGPRGRSRSPQRVLVVAPWTVRNLRVYDRFVLVASEGGVTFWTGNHPLARGEGDLAANPDIKVAGDRVPRGASGTDAEELEPLYYREALDYIAAHPGWWLGLLAEEGVLHGRAGRVRRIRYTRRCTGCRRSRRTCPAAVRALGVRRMAARRPHRPEALFLLAASAVIVCLLFFPQERFRIPVIDPALIVCAACAACARRACPDIEI